MYMESLLQKRIAKGKIDYEDYYSLFNNISVSLDLTSISPSEYVMECINEHFPTKSLLISKIDSLVSKDAVIFSTSTSLSITKLASASKFQDRGASLLRFTHGQQYR